MKNTILITNNLVVLPEKNGRASTQILGTLTSNLLYFGYTLSKDAYSKLMSVSDKTLKTWWGEIEPALKRVTGDDKKMDRFVVYKNFPQEVLEMSQAEYWFNQILMYWGFPSDLFTQEEVSRDKMFEKTTLKVLQEADKNALQRIFQNLLQLGARWNNEQRAFALFLAQENLSWKVSDIVFKENMAPFVSALRDAGVNVKLTSAMDVLRLAVGMSNGDITMATNTPFTRFTRADRRFFLNLLEKTSNLEEDVARDVERWKRFFNALHPFDYKGLINVHAVANALYKNEVTSFNGKVELALSKKQKTALNLLSQRPGDFIRRFHHVYGIFGAKAVEALNDVLPNLTTLQLLKFEKYLETIGQRDKLTVAPKGNWTKLQILPNTKSKIRKGHKEILTETIRKTVARRIREKVGTINLFESAAQIKLQTNEADLCSFGRGTTVYLPDNINFVRSASYWSTLNRGVTWFDNGWNFFDENWGSVDTLCWNSTGMGGAALFSGDPMSSKDSQGRACQMIDLYIDKLAERGIRYGVWNILCFSRVKFSEAKEVFAALQWGEDAQKGKTFEPSRAQFTVPVQGDSFAKYILYLDVKERKVVYMDANLKANVSSASYNTTTLSQTMPAFVEYLDTLPSVYDLFKHGRKSKKGVVVTFDDENVKVEKTGYVFKPLNKENKFKQLDLNSILTS